MGADVAASPHCPVRLDTKPGRRGSPPGGFEAGVEPGARTTILRGPSGARAPSGFPAGSPSGPKPWRFAAGRSGTGVPAPATCGAGAEARCRLRQDGFGRSLCPAWRSMDRSPGSAGFAAPGPKPGPARRFRDRSPFAAGGSAPTCVPLLPDRPRAEALHLSVDPEPEGPEPGCFTKPTAFASAKGQARSFRLAAASSAARPSLDRLMPGGTKSDVAPAVAGKALDRFRSIVSATGRKLSWNVIRTKGLAAVDNEDNGHK
jgi:hypothetical protein